MKLSGRFGVQWAHGCFTGEILGSSVVDLVSRLSNWAYGASYGLLFGLIWDTKWTY